MTFSASPSSTHSSSKAQFKHLLRYEAIPSSLLRGKAPHASELPEFLFLYPSLDSKFPEENTMAHSRYLSRTFAEIR